MNEKKKKILLIILALIISIAIIAFPFIFNAVKAETNTDKLLSPPKKSKSTISYPNTIDPEIYGIEYTVNQSAGDTYLFYPTASYTATGAWAIAAGMEYSYFNYDVNIYIAIIGTAEEGYEFGNYVLVKVTYFGYPASESTSPDPKTLETYYFGNIAEKNISLDRYKPEPPESYYNMEVSFGYFDHNLAVQGEKTIHQSFAIMGTYGNTMRYTIGNDPDDPSDTAAFGIDLTINENIKKYIINDDGAYGGLQNPETGTILNLTPLYVNVGYNNNYVQGYEEGKEAGLELGYNNGYTVGYQKGSLEANKDNSAIASFIPAMFGSVLAFTMNVGNGISIWGISLWTVIITAITIVIIVKVVKSIS